MKLPMKSLLVASVIGGLGACLALSAAANHPAPVYAYVTALGSNTVSMIETSTDTVVATVSVGGGPLGIGVSPDGNRAYVANAYDNSVSVIDGLSQSVIATVPVGLEPLGVAVSPDGTKVYVASTGGGISPGVSVIDAATNVVIAEIPLSDAPASAAVTANGESLYVGTIGGGVFVIDTATKQVIRTIPLPLGSGVDSIALAPNLPFGYVVNAPSGVIAVLNLRANKANRSVATGGGNVQAIALSPDGKRVYATDSNLAQVVVFDSASERHIQRIALPAGSNPIGISLTPDGRKAYVAGNSSSSVFVIDTMTTTILTTVSVVGSPYAKGQFIATQWAQ